MTNVIKQAESGKPFDVGSFLFDTAVGGALGAVGGAAGPLLSSAIRSVTTSGAGAAAVNAVRTGLQNTLNRMPSFRPAPAPVRPPVAPGGGAARPAGVQNEGIDLRLMYKPGWVAAQRDAADAKVSVLNEAALAGRLQTTTPVRNGSASRRFVAEGNDVPQGHDVDHIIDLQLGGADDVANMAPLDPSVNRSLGAQIAAQLRGVPAGTRVLSVTID